MSTEVVLIAIMATVYTLTLPIRWILGEAAFSFFDSILP